MSDELKKFIAENGLQGGTIIGCTVRKSPSFIGEHAPSCLTCKFMRMGDKYALHPEDKAKAKFCLRFPQIVQKRSDDWCGEYEPKPDEDDE